MKIQVYKCRFTGKIFEEKDRAKYIKHLRELRESLRSERNYERTRKTWKEWLAAEKAKIFKVEDVPAWFLENQRKIMDACNAIEFSSNFDRRNRFVQGDKFTKLEWETCRFEPLASNSHVNPEGGVSNWCAKDKTKPIGYPGWTGYLKGSLARPPKHQHTYPYSEALNLVGIRTGSGGGGNDSFGYGFTIFLADWPGLSEGLVFDTLKGKR
jgi:hypothetical protein